MRKYSKFNVRSMSTEIIESDPNKLQFVKRGNKRSGFFFLLMGLMFQILFLWGLWMVADQSGIWTFFTLGIIQSEIFPYLSIVFMFGGGCFLIVFREFGWKEHITIMNTGSSRILIGTHFFRWQRGQEILTDQIRTIRIHTIPLDLIGMINRYQLEIDYWLTDKTKLRTLLIYVDKEGKSRSTVTRLASKIHVLLGEGIQIEETTSAAPIAE